MGSKRMLTGVVLLFGCTALAAADFTVNRHHTEVMVRTNGILDVREELELYFHRQREHLVRFLPLSGKNLLHSLHTARISIDRVRAEGLSVRTAVSNDALYIRMGEPGETVSGIRQYRLHYRVRGAVFTNRDGARTIFWNMAGAGWPVPLRRVSWWLVFPAGYFGAAPGVRAWSDPLRIETIAVHTGDGVSMATGQLDGNLHPGSFLAVAVNLPESAIPGSPAERAVFPRVVLLPLPVYLAALFVLLLWWAYYRRLRSAAGDSPLPPQGLTAMEAGYLVDGRLNYRDIASQVFEWARRGWVTIALEEADGRPTVRISKRRAPEAGVVRFERELFAGIFPGKIGEQFSGSLTVHKLYKTTKKTAERMIEGLVGRGLMDREPRKFPRRFRMLAWVLFISASLFSIFFGDLLSIVPFTVFFLAVYLPAAGLPERSWTPEGRRLQRRLLGFRRFLLRSSRAHLDAAIGERRSWLEAALPVAIALDVHDRLLGRLRPEREELPRWFAYEGRRDPAAAFATAVQLTRRTLFTLLSSAEAAGQVRISGHWYIGTSGIRGGGGSGGTGGGGGGGAGGGCGGGGLGGGGGM